MIKSKRAIIHLSLFSVLCFSCIISSAQNEKSLIIRTNKSIGFKNYLIDFVNPQGAGTILGSAGGGFGIETGLSYSVGRSFELYGVLGYQQHLAMQYFSSSYGGSYNSSFLFSRASFIAGANFIIPIGKSEKAGFLVGAGGSYNVPGKMRIVELNKRYNDLVFSPDFGSHIEFGGFYKFKGWTFLPSLRVRILSLENQNYGTIDENTDKTFTKIGSEVNASGIDLSFTLRKRLGKE